MRGAGHGAAEVQADGWPSGDVLGDAGDTGGEVLAHDRVVLHHRIASCKQCAGFDDDEMVTSYAERVTEIAYAYDQVATQFQLCRTENATFAAMITDAGYYYDTGQWHVLTNQAAAVDAACSSAEGLLNDLRNYVDALA